ncbi:MAG: TonB-dependent receptor [Bacteroidetes bacterium]|nr:TonB-dependent receptor [Bacteroidota bacterium]
MGSSEFALSVEGPIKKVKQQTGENQNKHKGVESATMLASVRYSYLQGLFKLLKLPFLPSYLDAQYKIKIKFNQQNELILLGLGADDRFKLNLSANKSQEQRYLLNILPEQSQWNYSVGAKYTHYFKESYLNLILSRNMLGNHAYKYENNNPDNPKRFDYNSTEAENKFRLEVSGRKGAWKYNYGLSYEYARYTNQTTQEISYPGSIDLVTIDYNSHLLLHKWGLFAQVSRGFFRDRLELSAGLRTDNCSYNSVMAFAIQDQLSPRFSASFSILPGWLVNFNTGYYHQLPPYTGLGFRNNTGSLVNKNRLTYIHNVHVVLGTEYQTKWNSRFSVEGFYKQYFNYPFQLRDSVSLANLGGDFGVIGNTDLISNSDGRSYGVELLYEQKLFKGFYGIVAYTLFWSQFKDRHGAFLPSSWDSRQVISLTGGKKFKYHWEVGARWRISGGQPYTPYDIERSSIVQIWNFYGSGLPNYDQLNSKRNPWFHQLDIRITKKWFFKKWSLELYLDVQNVYAFKSSQAPYLDLVYDKNNQPLFVSGSVPPRYQTELIKNRNGQPIPTLGFVISY